MVVPLLPARFTTLLIQPSDDIDPSTGLDTQTLASAGAVSFGGVILGAAGAAGPITWSGTASSTQTTAFTAGEGSVSGIIAGFGINYDEPTDPDLLADGFDGAGGLGIKGVDGSTPIADTLGLTFSAPLPVGTSFALWDPGTEFGATGGPFTFTFSAANGATSVSLADWGFQLVDPFTGEVESGQYSYDPTTGTLTVTGISPYPDPHQPRKVLIVTTTAPITSFSVTGQTLSGDFFGLAVDVPAASGTAVTDTVLGAGGSTLAIPFLTPRDAALAVPLLDQVSARIAGGSTSVFAAGTQPSATGGTAVLTATATYAGAMTTYQGFFTTATGVSTLTGGTFGFQSIVAGLGGVLFTAAPVNAGGTVIAGGGNSAFVAPVQDGGNWLVHFGVGDNTVVAGSGSDTIDAGTGANLVFLGTGSNAFSSEGADTVVTATGAATVDALGPGDLLFAGTGGVQFTAAAGVSTVVALAGGTDSLFGGSGQILAFTFAPTRYVGAGSTDTVIGVGGALSVTGGAGGGLFFGTAAGGNVIAGGSGAATIIGGGPGDQISVAGSGPNLVAAGTGAETISAAAATGSNDFYLFSGGDVVTGGAGANAYSIGVGADTLTTAGTANVVVLYDIANDPANVTINDFTPGRDFIALLGFADGTAAAAVAAAADPSSGTVVTLPNGTTLTFAGLASVPSTSFVT